MDVLRCQSPELVRTEMWVCLLAYNLIRKTMLQAALLSRLSPRQLSFTVALQKLAASWGVSVVLPEAVLRTLIDVHLRQMARHRVGDRPDRVEPRAIKRRPKPHRLLQVPRAQARAALLAGGAAAE
jgi:hypothetical protein